MFWEKEWSSMDLYKYDAIILNNIEASQSRPRLYLDARQRFLPLV
jgi:hypothetical protein